MTYHVGTSDVGQTQAGSIGPWTPSGLHPQIDALLCSVWPQSFSQTLQQQTLFGGGLPAPWTACCYLIGSKAIEISERGEKLPRFLGLKGGHCAHEMCFSTSCFLAMLPEDALGSARPLFLHTHTPLFSAFMPVARTRPLLCHLNSTFCQTLGWPERCDNFLFDGRSSSLHTMFCAPGRKCWCQTICGAATANSLKLRLESNRPRREKGCSCLC